MQPCPQPPKAGVAFSLASRVRWQATSSNAISSWPEKGHWRLSGLAIVHRAVSRPRADSGSAMDRSDFAPAFKALRSGKSEGFSVPLQAKAKRPSFAVQTRWLCSPVCTGPSTAAANVHA
jgi:hypothetical protein